MTGASSAFRDVLSRRLIPDFCSDPARRCNPSGFREASVRVSDEDAGYFLMALDAGLIEHQGRGLYSASRSATCEQLFWEGPKLSEPRTFTLWLEPIITIAGLARLHFDHGWPRELIGTQSADWAFDLVTFVPGRANEFIAGEVKKSRREVQQLLDLMQAFGQRPEIGAPPRGRERNAWQKVAALRARRPPLFWALGPTCCGGVFEVRYGPDDKLNFVSVPSTALDYPRSQS